MTVVVLVASSLGVPVGGSVVSVPVTVGDGVCVGVPGPTGLSNGDNVLVGVGVSVAVLVGAPGTVVAAAVGVGST